MMSFADHTGGPVVLMAPDHAFALLRSVDGDGPMVIRGPRTVARYHADGPGPRCAELRLRPGQAAGLLGGRPLRELIDREVAVPEPDRPLPPPSGLIDRAVTLLTDGLIDRAVTLLTGGEPVHAVARRLHVSERHLRTLFTAATGLTPTAYVRLDRVRSVLAEPGWARYYDQSHMIGEFRRVMGVPPGAYAKGRRPPAVPCPSPPPVE
jgi:AraC-like DNA-binding protein